MNLINDPATQRTACTALDALLEILHEIIELYLQLIMDHLAGPSLPSSRSSPGAIGSAAHRLQGALHALMPPADDELSRDLPESHRT